MVTQDAHSRSGLDEGQQVNQAFDLVRPVFRRDRDIHSYYRQNALVYINTNAHELIAIARNVTAELLFNPIVDLVHPEKRPTSSPTAGRDVRNVQRLRMSITGRSSAAT